MSSLITAAKKYDSCTIYHDFMIGLGFNHTSFNTKDTGIAAIKEFLENNIAAPLSEKTR